MQSMTFNVDPLRTFARKHFWRVIKIVGITYLVCSTFLWHWLWSCVIGATWEITQLGKAEGERDRFRDYAAEQPVLNSLCNFGNLVIDVFQPMVSDDALIAHWKKHREGMERVAQMTARQQPDYSDFSKPEYVKVLHEVGIERIYRGEHAVGIQTFPKLGRYQQRYFCGFPGYSKHLAYYTGSYFPIETNGRLLAQLVEVDPDNPPKGARVVSNADYISTFRNEPLVRRLSERWYIWR